MFSILIGKNILFKIGEIKNNSQEKRLYFRKKSLKNSLRSLTRIDRINDIQKKKINILTLGVPNAVY